MIKIVPFEELSKVETPKLTDAQWDEFAARIDIKTQIVRYTSIEGAVRSYEGLLLECKPYCSQECPKSKHGDAGEGSERLLVQPFHQVRSVRISIRDLTFKGKDGLFRVFDQIMANPDGRG